MTDTDTSHSLEELLVQTRHRIEVERIELDEARKRRAAIVNALVSEFPGGQAYVNGSIAHGDALNPLTDVDLGIVVPNPDNTYGPGRRGPSELMDRAADAVRTRLKDDYAGLRVEVEGRKRSVLVRFRDPVTPGQPDFTADVIVAIDHAGADGLYIPRYTTWDCSHPVKHTDLVVAANHTSNVSYAHIVRLVKHWNRRHGKPLCSWNIKALALMSNTDPMSHLEGLQKWFHNAIRELKNGETPDPAGVSAPIKLNGVTRTEAIRKLSRAFDQLERAAGHDRAGRTTLAWYELAKFFNDEEVLAAPSTEAVLHAQAQLIAPPKSTPSTRRPAVVAGTGVGEGHGRTHVNARSWGV